MRRTDALGHSSNKYSNGDPGNYVLPTELLAEFLNYFQEEPINVIEALGITPSTSETQLRDAIHEPMVIFEVTPTTWAAVIKEQRGVSAVAYQASTGKYRITWETAFVDADYGVHPSFGIVGGGTRGTVNTITWTATHCEIEILDMTGSPQNVGNARITVSARGTPAD